MKALREARRERDEDHKRVDQALGRSPVFKMVRIHFDCGQIHDYFEGCFERAARGGLKGEPWQFVLPLANPPDPVHVSAKEIGMLLALQSDDAFEASID